jgi:glycosyltransferase involved in cell wall biosynthesis
VNQSFFADVQSLTGWSMSLLMPSRWKSEYSDAIAPTEWPGFKASVRRLPVLMPGKIPLHVYRTRITRILHQEAPDAIYVHNEPYALSTGQLYLANRRSSRCPIGFYTAQNIRKAYPLPFRQLESWVYGNSDFAFPVTEGALEIARQKGYRGKAEVLPLAVDQNVYYPQPEWARAKRAELELSADEVVIGFLGRLVEEKGLDTLFESLPLLGDRRYRVVIVGSGPYAGELRRLVDGAGLTSKTIFTGYVPHAEAARWFSLFDVSVLPSRTRAHWREQFGRVILESLACGTPVIGSDSGEIPAVLRSTGGSELVFAEGDPVQLAARLARLCDDPAARAAIVVDGQRAVREKYAQKHLALRFAQAIERSVSCSKTCLSH